MNVTIRVKLKERLEERNMNQTALRELIILKTGVTLRPQTISELYHDNKQFIYKNHLALIMQALELKSMDDLLEFVMIDE